MLDWFWEWIFGPNNPNETVINATNVSLITEEARARHAAFRSKFFNETKPCDICEVLFLQRIKKNTCPVPVIPAPTVSENTTDLTTFPEMTLLSNIERYYLFIGIFVFVGIYLIYIMKRHLWISRSSVPFRKNKDASNIETTKTILVVGANETGKKSIINAFKKMHPKSKNWNFKTQNFSEHRIPTSSDLIWLVLNYQSSIHENEFKILKYANNIPVILVINKVDLLQQNNINDDNVIRNFDERVPECLKTSKRLMNIRERLMEFRKYIVILSLRQDEDGDRELGIHNLIETTNKCLLSKNLESNPQTLVDYNADKHGLKVAHPIAGMRNATMRILLIGYTSTGKSSLINYLAGSNVAAVSSDGLPVTQKIEEYFIPDLNLTLIDSVGLEKKRDNTEKFKTLKNYRQPDFIWFLINYQSALEQDKLNLIGELFPLIPTIIVVNFMDILQTLQDDIVFETDTRLNNQQYQIEKQRLLKFKQSQTNVRHIIAMSLRSEEQGDKPRGLKLLYEATIKNFSNDIYL